MPASGVVPDERVALVKGVLIQCGGVPVDGVTANDGVGPADGVPMANGVTSSQTHPSQETHHVARMVGYSCATR
jgi:hypothetical protein